MRAFFCKIALTLLAIVVAGAAYAGEEVTFQASSPLTVAVGEPFRVEFSLNANPDKKSFQAPSFEGFDVLAGPSTSTGSSIQIVNGAMTKSVNVTFTYVLLAQAEGTCTIGEAQVEVDDRTYRTKPLLVEVVREKEAAQPSTTAPQQAEEPASSADVQGQIGKEDILLRAEVSRRSVYKNEPLYVVFKLYHRRVPISNVIPESAPSFNGFWSQDLNGQQTTAREGRETYNGRVYQTHVLSEYLLYPQQTGQLTIEPMEMTAVAQVVVPSRFQDPFFGRGHETLEVPRKIQSQRITIQVKPLPAGAPASFSGAVGNFTMTSERPSEHLVANSAATYTVKIAGKGNLTFVQAPKLSLPGSFEQYNVKTTESIQTSASGISGYRQFEYPFIARADGEYEVPAVEFTFFNPERMQYQTLSTQAMHLVVEPDGSIGSAPRVQGSGMSKEEIRLLGEDIRFIKLGDAQLAKRDAPFLFSGNYWLLLLCILGLFGVVYSILRKQIRESQNLVLVRGKRASKVAVQRFRLAKRWMEEQQQHAFYEEMLRALWGYMGDKFNIPMANLTKEHVREELFKRGIPVSEAQRFIAIITQCDEAQYSPVASARMSDVYAEGVDLISQIEAMIKR